MIFLRWKNTIAFHGNFQFFNDIDAEKKDRADLLSVRSSLNLFGNFVSEQVALKCESPIQERKGRPPQKARKLKTKKVLPLPC